VRQLRLRDIGGIIVIDFIDMANPKNRATVEGALRTELERDRTKTYVVEISPLGLVEMTRQNVTEGPREVMTKKCPTCGGDGIVISEHSAAVDVERKLRDLLRSRSQAVKVELNANVASILVGPGADRLKELEAQTKRRIFIQARENVHTDHFAVLGHGPLSQLAPEAPVEDGQQVTLELVEIGRHDAAAGVGKVEGLNVIVADAARLVGKKVKARIERVLDGTAYAALVSAPARPPEPITAESEAEKPTRAPRRKAAEAASAEPAPAEPETTEDVAEAVAETEAPVEEPDDLQTPKKRTRRGSRGGRGRTKKPAAQPEAQLEGDGAAAGVPDDAVAAAPRIHLPEEHIGRDGAESEPDAGATVTEAAVEPDTTEDGAEPKPVKKRTRRGSRGGRGRKKKPAVAAAETNGGGEVPQPAAEVEAEAEAEADGDQGSDWGYVPMSEWESDLTPDSRSR